MKKILGVSALLVLVAAGLCLFRENSPVEVRAGLSGQVSWTAEEGANVREGDGLVRIVGLTGDAVAARSPQDGTVESILVKPGDEISTDDVVAKLRK